MIHETDGGGDDYGVGYIRGVERSRDMHFFDKQLNQAEAHDGQQLHPSAVAGRYQDQDVERRTPVIATDGHSAICHAV
jgi:hypothetical protein